MKIFISEIDRLNTRSVALKNIARFFNIPKWRFKSNDDLEREIHDLSITNPEADKIRKLLKNYFTAYDKWFDFYQDKREFEIENDIEEYELNDAEQSELQELINERERTLFELKSEFDKLQLQNK
jgi:hypothetical protein